MALPMVGMAAGIGVGVMLGPIANPGDSTAAGVALLTQYRPQVDLISRAPVHSGGIVEADDMAGVGVAQAALASLFPRAL